ncbi:MAG: peptidoglycan D,D-transpeptidase FtsI family protein [Nocardioidaceae bacterium]
MTGSDRGRKASARGRRSKTRIRVSFVAIAFVVSLFAGRLFQLQGIDASAYAQMATAEGSQTVSLHAQRGVILDRNGVALADSINAEAITADPSITTKNATAIAAVLEHRLGLDYFSTVTALRHPNSRFVYLARQVPAWRADAIVNALNKANLPGVFTQRDPLRDYPAGTVAANVLGAVGTDDKGLAGLELAYNSTLTGKDGQATYEVSPTGEQIPLTQSSLEAPKQGVGLVTTIDRDVQWYADRRLAQAVREHGADWGAAVTVDVKTGQIIQLSNYPTFNPAKLSGANTANLGDRALENVYEPGSVEKVLTFSALADSGAVTPSSRITVPSGLTIDGHSIGDDWSHGILHLTAAGVVALSSNLGTIVASQKITDKHLYHYLRSFGLGSDPGLGIPGESAGLVPNPSTWAAINHATIAFGQGLSVTAVQMAAAISAVANHGVYIQPTLVSGFKNADGTVTPAKPPASHRVVSARAAAMVTRMMEAVTQTGGTAPAAAIPGYLVAGKTGTAQRVNPQTGQYDGTHTISFAGFAPADNPRFLTYVVLDRPRDGSFGGTAAAPVFKDIMSLLLQRYGIAPSVAKVPKIKLTW